LGVFGTHQDLPLYAVASHSSNIVGEISVVKVRKPRGIHPSLSKRHRLNDGDAKGPKNEPSGSETN